MTTETHTGPPLLRFGRRQSKGVLLGFSGIRLTAIGLALMFFVVSMFALGISGVAITAPLWVTLLAAAFLRWNGRPAIEAAPIVLHWATRASKPDTG
jgi:hypothetical protein